MGLDGSREKPQTGSDDPRLWWEDDWFVIPMITWFLAQYFVSALGEKALEEKA